MVPLVEGCHAQLVMWSSAITRASHPLTSLNAQNPPTRVCLEIGRALGHVPHPFALRHVEAISMPKRIQNWVPEAQTGAQWVPITNSGAKPQGFRCTD